MTVEQQLPRDTVEFFLQVYVKDSNGKERTICIPRHLKPEGLTIEELSIQLHIGVRDVIEELQLSRTYEREVKPTGDGTSLEAKRA